MRTISFKTRARTVDHLGREQIADVPTAISELWKNSYDAYARSVSLTVFPEHPLVVTIADDGHGMSYDELTDRWLVIGTESKLFDDDHSREDRDGLRPRPRQGQKGIGRLSCAHLGPLTLLISKRRGQDLTAALIDWRLFENPFLLLDDIEVPVVKVSSFEEFLTSVPTMCEELAKNVIGGDGTERLSRIRSAWTTYDHTTSARSAAPLEHPPSHAIVEACRSFDLQKRHLSTWPVWKREADKGTLLVVFGATEEFGSLLPEEKDFVSAQSDRRRLVSTLSGFVDPLFDPARPEASAAGTDFEYGVFTFREDGLEKVVGSDHEFNRELTNEMEHIVDGRIDENGVFHGQIKSFGVWRKTGSAYVIEPPKDFKLSNSKRSALGPFDIYFATFEQKVDNTTHTPQDFERFKTYSDDHGGLMIYRDGLRVLPYGREDNDFFEIERRRSINAGREYWNARRIFGRIAISREKNPNLKDKAGREGFIVNKAAKTLKTLVINILRSTAYDYFGSNSPDRKEEVAKANRNFKLEAAKEAQKALRAKNRKLFRSRLKKHNAAIPAIVEKVKLEIAQTKIEVAADIAVAQERLEALQASVAELRLPGVPSSLGTLEDDYRSYRRSLTEIAELVSDFSATISLAVERIQPPAPEAILQKQIERNEGQLASRVTRWAREIKSLQKDEQERVAGLTSERNKIFRRETKSLLDATAEGRTSLKDAIRNVNEIKARIDAENELLFQNYIFALENLRDSIDIQAAASLSGEENIELRAQVNRLNGLAQLGITVEFLDHELRGHDASIRDGIHQLREKIGEDSALLQVEDSYTGLKHILDFLGPLRLSGKVKARWFSGIEVYKYVANFFEQPLAAHDIKFRATDAFKDLRVYEHLPRILPVLLNLVNNSLYWLINSGTDEPEILFAFCGDRVIVADNGPGVDEIDVNRLFTLFFTRKSEGGRGVGLYLCRANLSAGNHTIDYVIEPGDKILPGANFAIKFRDGIFKADAEEGQRGN